MEIIRTFDLEASLDLAPLPTDWVIEGQPLTFSKEISHSRDRTTTLWRWSCTPGKFCWHYTVDETAHILSGEVYISDDTKIERLGPGDTAFFPAGSCSVWHVTQTVTKISVSRLPLPKIIGLGVRIWNKLLNYGNTFKRVPHITKSEKRGHWK